MSSLYAWYSWSSSPMCPIHVWVDYELLRGLWQGIIGPWGVGEKIQYRTKLRVDDDMSHTLVEKLRLQITNKWNRVYLSENWDTKWPISETGWSLYPEDRGDIVVRWFEKERNSIPKTSTGVEENIYIYVYWIWRKNLSDATAETFCLTYYGTEN